LPLENVQLIAFDFDGVFTDNTVYVSQDGMESVRCWRSDGLGLSRLRAAGVHAFIISTEVNPVVTARARKLDLLCRQGVDDKALAVRQACADFGVAPERTMFVGNDINDIPAFQVVGLPVGVADCHPDILPHVSFTTERPGGFGAVREVCDRVVAAKSERLDGQHAA
jgi:3-deoxy-D-manno-octulosonate 8-phosphate phosphatase (KDO 8-P phosphatase)